LTDGFSRVHRRATGGGARRQLGPSGVLRGRLVAADPVLPGAVQLILRARAVDSDDGSSSSETPAQRSLRHLIMHTIYIIYI